MPTLKKHDSTRASNYAGEIAQELVSLGAITVEMRYAQEHITALAWIMPVNGAVAHFLMPARVDSVLKMLIKREPTLSPTELGRLSRRAERIAWRYLARWVEAQGTMVRAGMLAPAEPFVSFAVFPGGTRTLFEIFAERGRLEAAAETKP
jgi:hypothetical protein